MISTIDREKIAHFVRNTLGCTCPDAVFDRIEFASDDGSSLGLMIGGRLRIRVLHVDAADRNLAPHLAQWIADGRRERDARGFKRFRLVLAADDPPEVDRLAQAALKQISVVDDRAHIHVLSNTQLDAALQGAGVGWSR